MTIELFGLPQEDKNAMLFAEAEMSAMSDAAEDTFRYLMNIVNVEMYSEAEGTKSNNIFAKIWGFIKSLVKSVITFIKKVAKETIRLILLPFSSKMKVAEAGGGAGSATARSGEPSTSNPMSTNYDNIKEVNSLIKNLYRYGKRFNVSKDISSIEEFKNIKLSDILDNGFVDTKNFKNVDSSKIYKPGDVKDIIDYGSKIINNFYNMKGDSDITYDKFVQFVNGTNLKNHKVLDGSLNVIPIGKSDEVEDIFTVFECLGPFINNIIEYCKTINGLSERVIKETEKGDAGVSHISKIQISNYFNKKIENELQINVSDKIENIKLFGKPADEVLKLGKLLILATGENMYSSIDSKVLNKYLKEFNRSKYNVTQSSFSSYKDTLTNKIYEFDIKNLFKTVKVSGNLKELANGEFSETLNDSKFDKIFKSIEVLTKLNENFFEPTNSNDKSAAENLADKIDTSVQAAARTTSSWKSLLSGVSKIIRNLGNQTIKVCSDIRYFVNNVDGLYVFCDNLYRFNKYLYFFDYICLYSYEITNILNEPDMLDKVYGGDQIALDKDKLAVKNMVATVQKILVEAIEDTADVK